MDDNINKDWESMYKSLSFTIYNQFTLTMRALQKGDKTYYAHALLTIYQSVDKDIMKIIEDYNMG